MFILLKYQVNWVERTENMIHLHYALHAGHYKHASSLSDLTLPRSIWIERYLKFDREVRVILFCEQHIVE